MRFRDAPRRHGFAPVSSGAEFLGQRSAPSSVDSLGKPVYRFARMDTLLVRNLRAAEGYLELGMPGEALREIEELPADLQNELPAVLARMEVYQRQKRWADGSELGRAALKRFPEYGSLYLLTSYSVRRHEGLEHARSVLVSGEPFLGSEALFHYNMGCYECQLSDLAGAKARLTTAFTLEPRYIEVGLNDSDLTELREWIAAAELASKRIR